MKINTRSGLSWGVVGLAMIFLSLILEMLFFGPIATQQSPGENFSTSGALALNLLHTLVKLLDVAGIAFVVLGLIHVMIETKDWSSYFRDRIREIVMEQSYLNTLDKDRLTALQTSVLKAQFKDKAIDREGSFLSYLQQNLHHYIAEPYREDVTTEMIYSDAGDFWEIFDRVTYVCRRTTTGIQRNFTYQVDLNEYASLEYLTVEVQFPYTHEERGKRRLLYEGQPELGPHFILSLSEYEQVDGLIVIASVKYKVYKNHFQYWTMADPTKNFDITLTFPSDHEVQVKPMVLTPELVLTTVTDGYYKAKYDFWMLPQSGMAWIILPKIADKNVKERSKPQDEGASPCDIQSAR